MKTKLTLYLILLFLLQNCSDDGVSTDDKNLGEVLVKTKVSFSDETPRDHVIIDLQKLNENESSFETKSTATTDINGLALFKNLESGQYRIIPRINDSIGQVITGQTTIDENNYKDSIEVRVFYYWNFNEYESIINVDTSINFVGMQSFFYNNGIRDTLHCQFDESNIPSWMEFSYNITVFPPDVDGSNGSYLLFGYDDNKIPIDQLPIIVNIPIQHQYGITDYKVIFELKE